MATCTCRRATSHQRREPALGSQLSHLHVYEWAGAEDRRPLVEGVERWRAALAAAATVTGAWSDDRYAFLEFVSGDDVDAVRRDAGVLLRWLDQVKSEA